LATKIDFLVSTGSNAGLRDLTQEADLAGPCESCLAKGGGWCTSEQRCVEDDIEHCDAESLIGLAGFTNDCNADQERHKPAVRNWIDKDVLVLYTYENGTCCMGMGIVHRAYHVLEEYTVLLRDGSREEVKTDRWNRRKPAKKKDEASEYHNMELRYFRPHELTVISGVRTGDVVQAHFAVKNKGSENELVKSRQTELAVVVNVTTVNITVNFTSDYIVSTLPRDFIIDTTNNTRPAEKPTHEEL